MALKGGSKGVSAKRTSDTIRRLQGLRKDATRPVSFRLDPKEYELLVKHASELGIKPAQLVKSWVLQRMRQEGIK